ncbi:MAG: hypothetical protein A2Y66_05200 [Nitrospirae bacterium RBG_13_41_22]|nr:MAG: hypothetical protein A2Y66_05200 [Nitrospirae bacterium RBG_13_41_22]
MIINCRDWLQFMGAILVIIGLGVWGIYVVERYLLHLNVTDRQFLPFHLITIIPGMLLWQHRFLTNLIRKWLRREGK